jgi:hypothetical protein
MELIKLFERAIYEKDELILENCIIILFKQTNKKDEFYYPKIEKLLIAQWHHLHEDLVNMIYLKKLKDNRFIQPIMDIALNREIFRPFDDELESTLRKCVHALKTIGTDESDKALRILLESGNENVKYALENYK